MSNVKSPPNLADVLYVVSAHHQEEGNMAVALNITTWTDKRVWMSIVDMKHKPKLMSEDVFMIGATRLVIACKKQDSMDVVRRLCDMGADVETKDDEGNSALSAACSAGNKSAARFLLVDMHANIESKNNKGWTPLVWSCLHGRAALVELLIARNATINVLTNDFESALGLASKHAHVDIVRTLLRNSANVELGSPSPILMAYQYDQQDEDDEEDTMTVIQPFVKSAFWAKQAQIVRLLAESNANFSVVDDDGRTPLLLECRKLGRGPVVQLLLDGHKENIDVLDAIENCSALYFASRFAHIEAVRVLLSQGANVDVGTAPILGACSGIDEVGDLSTLWENRTEIVRLLADHNANLNVVDADGENALHFASRYGQTDVIKILCAGQVPIDSTNFDQHSAFWMACYYAHVEAVRELIALGANVNLGHPLIDACDAFDFDEHYSQDMSTFWARRCEIVIELVRARANLYIAGVDGWTPIDIARARRRHDIIAVLEGAMALPMEVIELYSSSDDASNEGDLDEEEEEEEEEEDGEKEEEEEEENDGDDDENEEEKEEDEEEAVEDVLKLLLVKHGHVNSLVGNKSSLGWACYWAKVEVVEALLSLGADINRISGGVSPIAIACSPLSVKDQLCIENAFSRFWQRRYEVVRLLIGCGVDLEVEDVNGDSPTKLAKLSGQQVIAEELEASLRFSRASR